MNLSQLKREKLIETLEFLKQSVCTREIISKLDEIELELNRKKYGLVWEEHEEKVDKELEKKIPVFKEMKEFEIKKDSKKPLNFLLEGDNLHSLYLLEKTHKGKIDLIYIDPPYNTLKKDDFIYDDKCVDENDDFKHSKWLSFMNRRLKIAKKLLKKDGIIFISIDENEYAGLKLLCDEIFGENNLLSVQHIQVRYADKTLNEKNDWQPVMEYVLIYANNKEKFKANKQKEEYSIEKFIYEFKELTPGTEFYVKGRKVTVFKKGEWKLIKHEEPDTKFLKETWVSGSIYTGTGNGTMVQNVIEPRILTDGYGSLYKIDGLGEDGLGYRYFTGPQREGATRSKMFSGVPLKRTTELDEGEAVKYKSIPNYHDYSADFGNIRHEGGIGFNSGKKPVKMLKEFINYHKNKNAIVLDFFAGSGSTAQAVLELNNDDGGNREFIICTNNESNICTEITYPRVKNVIDGYGKYKGIDANLKYFKTDFIDRNELYSDDIEVSDELMKYIKELIMLENNIDFTENLVKIAFSEEDVDKYIDKYDGFKKLYISSDILLSIEQEDKLEQYGVGIIEIPEYYYREEMES